jgi:hypothetical protein
VTRPEHGSEEVLESYAASRRFTLGRPRDLTLVPADGRMLFLRSVAADDPVTALWSLDLGAGSERLLADPRVLLDGAAEVIPAAEPRRRERLHLPPSGPLLHLPPPPRASREPCREPNSVKGPLLSLLWQRRAGDTIARRGLPTSAARYAVIYTILASTACGFRSTFPLWPRRDRFRSTPHSGRRLVGTAGRRLERRHLIR